jgi:hypothetical protein
MDYLKSDAPIRGQKYATLSFLCPEDILKKKDVYFFGEYLRNFSRRVNDLFESLSLRYPECAELIQSVKEMHSDVHDEEKILESFNFWVKSNASDLEEKFHEQNNFQTSIRGIKIRGVHATKKEADAHAQLLKVSDPNHNIWVGDVGSWLPFSDNPESIPNQEYAEESLNNLMKEYNKNRVKATQEFQSRTMAPFLDDASEDLWLKHKNRPAQELLEDAGTSQ